MYLVSGLSDKRFPDVLERVAQAQLKTLRFGLAFD